uniref:SFRICE_003265 n=1 Tax=Spodoptera frugiperda TaxID=7108 RepID=A0A2H1WIK1_SPOFR
MNGLDRSHTKALQKTIILLIIKYYIHQKISIEENYFKETTWSLNLYVIAIHTLNFVAQGSFLHSP